jgi:hypothetical protein
VMPRWSDTSSMKTYFTKPFFIDELFDKTGKLVPALQDNVTRIAKRFFCLFL